MKTDGSSRRDKVVISGALPNGASIETVYAADRNATALVVFQDGELR
jgi:hypothetical protein